MGDHLGMVVLAVASSLVLVRSFQLGWFDISPTQELDTTTTRDVSITAEAIVSSLQDLKRVSLAISLPFLAGVISIKKKSLDAIGVTFAFVVGFVLTMSNYGFFAMLMAFFASSVAFTRFRQDLKSKQDKEAEKKPRSSANVVCNSLPTVVCSVLYWCLTTDQSSKHDCLTSYGLMSAVTASIASVCADTWASELGSAIQRDTTRLIITPWKRVPAGTNGGVTIAGFAASLSGGIFIGLIGSLSMYLSPEEHCDDQVLILSLVLIGAISGLLGSVVDSILGATLQYSGFDEQTKRIVGDEDHENDLVKHVSGVPLMSNHTVNLVSCFIITFISPVIARFVLQGISY